MEFLSSPEAGLWGLFLSSFLSATLLPGGSEAVLFAVLRAHPDRATAALLLATLGNTLGGMTTYAMARLLSRNTPGSPKCFLAPCGEKRAKRVFRGGLIVGKVSGRGTVEHADKHIAQLRRWGPAALLFAWAPVVGDALCAAAGWLRLPLFASVFWMALGKGLRYVLVAAGASAF